MNRPPPRSPLFPYTPLFRSERRPHRPLGVVLGRYRSAPDRHDGVPDELLHRAAVALDQCPARVEVAGEKLADLLVVADRKSTRLNSSHSQISYAVFCLKKKT